MACTPLVAAIQVKNEVRQTLKSRARRNPNGHRTSRDFDNVAVLQRRDAQPADDFDRCRGADVGEKLNERALDERRPRDRDEEETNREGKLRNARKSGTQGNCDQGQSDGFQCQKPTNHAPLGIRFLQEAGRQPEEGQSRKKKNHFSSPIGFAR